MRFPRTRSLSLPLRISIGNLTTGAHEWNKKMEMLDNRMRPVHPGEILREDYLVPLGMTATALAKSLSVPAPRINDIVRERRSVTADTAMRLARYFGGDA